MCISEISKTGIVPVIKLTKIENSERLAEALLNGGVNVAEITFRAAGAENVIRRITKNFPDMIVGAGTVVNLEQARSAAEAGAKFVVSPGIDEEIVKWTQDNGLVPLPGCVTPTEIMIAVRFGINVVKFFPAAQYGGVDTIKALSGPFESLRFIPTGGISIGNLAEYAGEEKVAACGGSFMVSSKLLEEEKWNEITEICIEARNIIELARKIRRK
ncbi:putative KHG/KDPG aldolase [bioreactor metagenome]|jgi:2-dehydro-3-deoxyphosphogluconate aldolase/(4S)-4-hydroxy-2-oxoglutarate aldolase|uniref:2-dehydro-3-deoxy-phosphogluconate aldolase n=2 Tax=root TaxID=1 RepID=A0A562J5K7_9FIRM|nr:bifunctional 4-hydroxy-2-oxoglutarate aldolase/2-dehydro-3-deoxy-phosphogluconate aldolase [Sedimentibacter saalensis]MEA5096176.1 bifunctional 4-hydroxy-2-oxoglutarate aldolase/2-dehydro-3-deoxy-phosphogluconate aldolase [Sedimentibacter saalensis]TWH78194.1 2-dehydro-3-deoxyphosphogluconate aldolase/(4S)-4-hydroxy-2-oxoglutarate aldolase [Sedimentibacter saalensis]